VLKGNGSSAPVKPSPGPGTSHGRAAVQVGNGGVPGEAGEGALHRHVPGVRVDQQVDHPHAGGRAAGHTGKQRGSERHPWGRRDIDIYFGMPSGMLWIPKLLADVGKQCKTKKDGLVHYLNVVRFFFRPSQTIDSSNNQVE